MCENLNFALWQGERRSPKNIEKQRSFFLYRLFFCVFGSDDERRRARVATKQKAVFRYIQVYIHVRKSEFCFVARREEKPPKHEKTAITLKI